MNLKEMTEFIVIFCDKRKMFGRCSSTDMVGGQEEINLSKVFSLSLSLSLSVSLPVSLSVSLSLSLERRKVQKRGREWSLLQYVQRENPGRELAQRETIIIINQADMAFVGQYTKLKHFNLETVTVNFK